MPRLAAYTPQFRELTLDECHGILARHHVGRIAYVFHDRVDIEPIHFVYADGEIVFRTAPGSKFEVLRHHPWVAFEVDEVDGMFDWRSVVAHGTVYRLEHSGSRADVAAYRRAVSQLRSLVDGALRANDPVPFRDIVVRLYVDRLTGRAAEPGTPPAPAPAPQNKRGGARRRTPPLVR
jgi:nitroimidazol reductase NimA-like FMN-containing flavoprotein (pyridoxamine 5'-phosphate oxidase superfamily)